MTFTYLISNGSAVKIGHTTDVQRRLRQLQSASPVPLRVIGILDGVEPERRLHQEYASYRMNGEWFAIPVAASFYLWLVMQADRDDWIGDVARDAKEDTLFPKEETSYQRLQSYLIWHQACHRARIGLAKAYREWLRLRRA
jgi:uncharacterized protein YozE (UPF0346 family)